jgi:single-strand DNA-binding protein
MEPAIAVLSVAARAAALDGKQLECNMAKSVNKVILVGNVGQDPEVKYTASGVPVAKVSLATNERFKNRNEQWQDRTEWHSVVAWQRLAEIIGEYVHKGSKLYVEGKLQTSTWEDKQTREKRYRTEIVAREILLLSSRESGQGDRQTTSGEEATPDSVSAAADDAIPF